MFLNAPKLQLLNVLFLVIEDVLPEGVSFQDLHIGSEADDKAAGTFQRVNHRPEKPATILPLEVLFRQRKLRIRFVSPGESVGGFLATFYDVQDVVEFADDGAFFVKLLDYLPFPGLPDECRWSIG